jgi:hypothetical protein
MLIQKQQARPLWDDGPMLYQVEVKRQGCLVTNHLIEALDGLTAINQVERYYGEPPEFDIVTVELEHNRKRHLLLVDNWHGYTFQARLAGPETGAAIVETDIPHPEFARN